RRPAAGGLSPQHRCRTDRRHFQDARPRMAADDRPRGGFSPHDRELPVSRVALRAEWQAGALDKHAYARRMGVEHQALADYRALLVEGDIASITIDARGVILESRLAEARFVCDPEDRGIPPIVALNFGSYEAKDFAMVMELFADGQTFVDAGANIGWYSIHVAARFPAARVVAFEPVPASYAWLRAHLGLHRLSNVTTVPAGLWSSAGEQVLFIDPTIAGAASVAPSAHAETEQRAV